VQAGDTRDSWASGVIRGSGAVALRRWYHLALTRRQSAVYRFADGSLLATGWSSSVIGNNYPLSVGFPANGVEYVNAVGRLPMADSLILSTTWSEQATLWTQNEHFAGLPGVEYRTARTKAPSARRTPRR
jgi:hypothetical protein